MAITVSCSCGASFKAKDHLAGKRVKCPKCQGVIDVPAARPTVSQVAGSSSSSASANNPLLDLLDEAGVKSVQTGPKCPACAEAMAPTAVICVNCGYNVATGEYLDTYVEMEESQDGKGELSDAQRIMAKAEQSIDESPETAAGQDFGDGADAWVIAAGALAIFAAMVCIGVVVVLTMESVADSTGVVFITILGCIFILNLARIWIIVVAFFEGVEHGITCLFFDVYTVYYGFTRGLKWQSIVLIIAWVGTVTAYATRGYFEGEGAEDASAMVMRMLAG